MNGAVACEKKREVSKDRRRWFDEGLTTVTVVARISTAGAPTYHTIAPRVRTILK